MTTKDRLRRGPLVVAAGGPHEPGITSAEQTAVAREGKRKPTVLHHVGAVLVFISTALAIAPAVALHSSSTVTPDLIDPVFYAWDVASVVHHVLLWAHGLWSPFDANVYYPTPHAAAYTDAAVGILPFSLPLHWLGIAPIAALNILIGLSFVLSAYGAFALVRLLTGSSAAGLLAGLIFELCPLRMEHIGHLNVLSTQWLVAAAYCWVVAWQRGQLWWWLLAGLLAGLSAVTNLYYLAYLALPLGVVALAQRRAWTGVRARGSLLAAGTAALLVVPYMVPYLIRRADVGPHYGSAASIDILSFVQVLPGRPIDSLLFPVVPFQMMQPNHGLFPGLVPLGLAVVAWRRGKARLWALFALACGMVALGPQLQVHGRLLPVPLLYAALQRVVPHFTLFRDPPRATIGLYLGLAVMAGWGVCTILAHVPVPAHRRALVALLAVLLVLELWTPIPTAVVPAVPGGERWLAQQPGIHSVVELPITGDTPRDWQRQSEIMYDSTVHWRMLVNGASSLAPVGMSQRAALVNGFPSAAARAELRRLHVDAVVLRLGWLPAGQRMAARSACHIAYSDHTEEICLGPWER